MSEIERIKSVLAAATPGPWQFERTPSGMVKLDPGIGWAVAGVHGEAAALANAELIANAPVWLAWLLRTVVADPAVTE